MEERFEIRKRIQEKINNFLTGINMLDFKVERILRTDSLKRKEYISPIISYLRFTKFFFCQKILKKIYKIIIGYYFCISYVTKIRNYLDFK